MDREVCECATHGPRPKTYVCAHVAEAASHGATAGFVTYPADDDDDLSDAWCEACEAYLQANGGEWIDDAVEVPDGLAILCADCYLEAKSIAASKGRLHVNR
jgi:hypothetical protein